MLYYRCKCGALESLGSLSPAPCIACGTCGSSLSASRNTHTEPIAHVWEDEWDIDRKTGERWKQQRCRACTELRTISVLINGTTHALTRVQVPASLIQFLSGHVWAQGVHLDGRRIPDQEMIDLTDGMTFRENASE